jgi:hypothetical protein
MQLKSYDRMLSGATRFSGELPESVTPVHHRATAAHACEGVRIIRFPRLLSPALCLGAIALFGSARAAPPSAPLAYAQSPDGFVSVKGERALLMGYRGGLEMWAYPLQLLSDYRVRFRVAGQVAAIDADTLLRRVERRPTETIRIYVGQDFVVRERLFVPRQQAGAILRYEVYGRPDVRIELSFRPSLNLMWPGALGGQTIGWDTALSGYVEREPLHGLTATITSAEATGHDVPRNAAQRGTQAMSMVLTPRFAPDGVRRAALYIAADPASAAPGALSASLAAHEAALRREAADHAETVLAGSLRITTPDAAVNEALVSATLALDQAWACAPGIGCGVVAGYGASRPGRRPQYAWFFAGDGLTAMRAMIDAGQYERAREELTFVTRYQNKKTGMIWHEMSQSAPLIDWANKYPYMFVHVDITFQYLAAVQSYVEATGDTAWARGNWRDLAAAYGYCTSIIDRASGLPRIPAGKEGQNEQDALSDDIRLSSAWIDAADGFARLARATGHGALAADADGRAQRARAALARDGWDAARGFWLSGHTLAGEPVHSEHADALPVLGQHVFTPLQADAVLDRIVSPEFTTDWGLRNLSAHAPEYDPNLYGSGSVWALATATAAVTLWAQHHPLAAFDLWHGLIGWNTLDSAGHIHELLAGDLYHPEVESVPEQTWSSAGVIGSTVEGLLGIEVHAATRTLRLAPHLPARWDKLTVDGIRVGTSIIDATIVRDEHGVALAVHNAGPDVKVDFAPALPLGATLGRATNDGAAAAVTLKAHPQDSHARLRFTARSGLTNIRLAYEGGMEIATDDTIPALGDPSVKPRIVRATLTVGGLSVDAWIASPEHSSFDLITALHPAAVDGASLEPLSDRVYRVHMRASASCCTYRAAHVLIHFRQ